MLRACGKLQGTKSCEVRFSTSSRPDEILYMCVCVCVAQMVSAVCQFPTVQSAVEASVAIMQSSIPIARIGLHSVFPWLL